MCIRKYLKQAVRTPQIPSERPKKDSLRGTTEGVERRGGLEGGVGRAGSEGGRAAWMRRWGSEWVDGKGIYAIYSRHHAPLGELQAKEGGWRSEGRKGLWALWIEISCDEDISCTTPINLPGPVQPSR